MVVTLSLEFADLLTTPEIETIVDRLEQHIRIAFPEVIAVFIKPQTAATYGKLAQHRYGTARAGYPRCCISTSSVMSRWVLLRLTSFLA